MPRRRRLQLTGLPVHIIQRGNNRQACFFAEADYQFFLHHLGELAKRFKCELHAYVLMTNHVHILLTPYFERGPSLLMKFLGQRYVQYINKTYRRSGTLWEGRFRSSFVQDGRYLLACYRYVEMNPVRANMVKRPIEYPWSSYAANAAGKQVAWLTPHGEYLALGSDDEKRQAAYRNLFAADLDPQLLHQIRTSAHSGYAIGSRRFREEIQIALKQRAMPREPGHPSGIIGKITEVHRIKASIHEKAKTLRESPCPWAGQPAGSPTADPQGECSAKLTASRRTQQATAQPTALGKLCISRPREGGDPVIL